MNMALKYDNGQSLAKNYKIMKKHTETDEDYMRQM